LINKDVVRNFTIFILILVSFSCKKEEKFPSGTTLRGPFCLSLIGDKKVTFTYFSQYIPIIFPTPKEVDPDYFDIYESEGQINNFKEFVKLKNDNIYKYTLDGLNNGTTYYFYVVGEKEGYKPLCSDTIMIIPNQKLTFDTLVTIKNNHSISSVSYSPVANKIAYVDKNYAWNGGDNCCMAESIILSSIDNQDSGLIAIDSYDPNWSSNGDTIVFAEETLRHGYYSQIAIYDLNSKAITKLTNDTTYYYNPTFSPSDDKILYQSNKNRPDINSTNIWMMDLGTYKTELIIDLSKTNFANISRPDWMDENDFIFQGTSSNNMTSIYKSSILTKKIEPLIESRWNDYNATISPNADQIAFISDRSGSEQLWLYNLQTKDYKQLTGYDDNDYFDGNWTKIDWIDNNQLLFTFGDNRLTKLLLK
jgi:Tol biopolymer transport system component